MENPRILHHLENLRILHHFEDPKMVNHLEVTKMISHLKDPGFKNLSLLYSKVGANSYIILTFFVMVFCPFVFKSAVEMGIFGRLVGIINM